MSRYLHKLVRRTVGGAAPPVPLEPGSQPETVATADVDPFEATAASVPALMPQPRQPVLRMEGAPPPLAPAPAPSRIEPPLVRHEPPPPEVPLVSVRRVHAEPPLARREPAPHETAEPAAAPEEVHMPPQEMRPAETSPPTERLEPRRRAPLAHVPELADEVRVPPERRRGKLAEDRPAALPHQARPQLEPPERPVAPLPHQARREFEPPERPVAPLPPVPIEEAPALLSPPPVRPARENVLEPEPDTPRLVIGHLQVDVVPAQPPVREVVRVVSRAPAGATRSFPAASKLRFGLGQM